MRNRGGKGGGSFGGGGGRNVEDEWDVSTILQHYDYSKPRPCVGLCYIMKLRGGPEPVHPKHPPEERTACVGMCHRPGGGTHQETLETGNEEEEEGLCWSLS